MNGSIYHHACTQTPIVRTETKDTSNLRTRETQTSETRTLSVQSYREAGKIMKKIDLKLEFGIRNRSFKSFRAAAEENNWARYYGGLHFHNSCIVSTDIGRKVGQLVVDRLIMKK